MVTTWPPVMSRSLLGTRSLFPGPPAPTLNATRVPPTYTLNTDVQHS
jgi:hypothetical protein